jgi:hypothetical protein
MQNVVNEQLVWSNKQDVSNEKQEVTCMPNRRHIL